jgi:DTW domain-containing protein YfiP
MCSKRRETKKDRCARCQINYRLCFCEYLKPIAIKTPVQVVMHISETQLTSNTVNLLKQVHQDCHIYLRGQQGERPDFQEALLEERYTPLYLFPNDDAIVLTKEFLNQCEKPINLIVPDGTWRQAKKIKKRIPEFEKIQSVTLPGVITSNYKLRTPPKDGMLSTFEAISKALGIIEGEDIERELEKVFEIMNERVLASRTGGLI